MSTTPEYLSYALELLSEAPEITHRKMMGEYLLYSQGVLFGGIYDNSVLLKKTPSSEAALSTAVLPYEGSKTPMMVCDIEDRAALADLVCRMVEELR